MTLQFGLVALDIVSSWIRMMLALGLSIIFALAVGIWAARSKKAESVILPLLDIFQSIPILGFFPFVIGAIYGTIPNFIGANLAVIVLIFTSMSWNIAFGVYEAVKAIPQDYADLLNVSQASAWQRIRTLYIPASLSRIAYNTQISWAVGLFFLVASEIISVGSTTIPVQYGIGIAATYFPAQHDYADYGLTIAGIVVAVVVWRYLFLRAFALWSEKYKMMEEPRERHRDPITRFYSWVNHRAVSKLFLISPGAGVSKFTSVLTKFRRGLKYAVLIFLIAFALLLVSIASSSGTLSLSNLPSGSLILSTESSVLYALGASFVRVWYVYAICVAIGLPMGIIISLNFKLYDTVSPILEVISSIPAPILLPAIVLIPLIGGSSEAVAAIVIILAIIWYVIFNVMAGVRTLPADIKDLPHVYKVGSWSAWRNVYLPGAMTGFVTGSITAIGGAWNALIIAEYFTNTDPSTGQTFLVTQVGTGIGKVIAVATATTPPDYLTLTLAVLSMTALIVTFNLTVWRRLYHYVTKRYTYNR
ncbi:MAG TPA: ABC transporter permease subunit [Nitrososphaerales archaeon]|nr:ABC transporter permease subunit [Nitrososphaerales archaeon]